MRKDYQIFFDNISENSKIIDIGCGEGEFLQKLKLEKNCKTYGIDVDSKKIAASINKGLSVVQGDANLELPHYPGKQETNHPFNYAILANTIQVIEDPKTVLEQVKRIAEKVFISAPNFGYIQNRLYFGLKGRMPVTKQLPYEWYNTPNIHFSTIKDMVVLLEEVGFNIEEFYYLNSDRKITKGNKNSLLIPNIFARSGIYLMGC